MVYSCGKWYIVRGTWYYIPRTLYMVLNVQYIGRTYGAIAKS
jgi:hypothetical protein